MSERKKEKIKEIIISASTLGFMIDHISGKDWWLFADNEGFCGPKQSVNIINQCAVVCKCWQTRKMHTMMLLKETCLACTKRLKVIEWSRKKMYLVFCVCFVSDCRGTNYCLNFIFVQRQFLNMQWVDASLYCLVDFQYKHRLMSSLFSAYLCFVFLSVIWKTFCFTKTLKNSSLGIITTPKFCFFV